MDHTVLLRFFQLYQRLFDFFSEISAKTMLLLEKNEKL